MTFSSVQIIINVRNAESIRCGLRQWDIGERDLEKKNGMAMLRPANAHPFATAQQPAEAKAGLRLKGLG